MGSQEEVSYVKRESAEGPTSFHGQQLVFALQLPLGPGTLSVELMRTFSPKEKGRLIATGQADVLDVLPPLSLGKQVESRQLIVLLKPASGQQQQGGWVGVYLARAGNGGMMIPRSLLFKLPFPPFR